MAPVLGPHLRPGNYKRRAGKTQGPALGLAQSNARQSQSSEECGKAEEATCQGWLLMFLRTIEMRTQSKSYCFVEGQSVVAHLFAHAGSQNVVDSGFEAVDRSQGGRGECFRQF